MDWAEGVLLSNRSTNQMRIKETDIGSAHLAGPKRWGTIAWALHITALLTSESEAINSKFPYSDTMLSKQSSGLVLAGQVCVSTG